MLSAQLETIRRSLNTICHPGGHYELRALHPIGESSAIKGYYGVFDNLELMAQAAYDLSLMARGVFVTLNPLEDSLAVTNSIDTVRKGTGATDSLVRKRRWLPIDLDPVRPPHTSSTGEEKKNALDKARQIKAYLTAMGFPAPVVGDSGNGVHLLYRVELPTDDNGLTKQFLRALHSRFSDGSVTVDSKVYNPSRIWKVYGTVARKGDDLDDRPHRLARLGKVPERLDCVAVSQVQAVIAQLNSEIQSDVLKAELDKDSRKPFDVEGWATSLPIELEGPVSWDEGGRRWVFPVCPFDESHTDSSAYVVQFDSGAVAAGCHHEGCTWGWKDLKEKFPPLRIGNVSPEVAINESYGFPATDIGNAQRLVEAHGRDLRYIGAQKRWLVWSGKRWLADSNDIVTHRAQAVAVSIGQEARACDNPERTKALYAWAKHSQSLHRILAMVALAQTDPSIAIDSTVMNRKRDRINLANGVLDLETGEFSKHRRDDMDTRLTEFVYDEDAECPMWEAFVLECMNGDVEMAKFLQRAFGATLSGRVPDEKVFYLVGEGRNGKSTMLQVLMSLMRDYAVQSPPNLLTETRGGFEAHPTELATLEGKRLVLAAETRQGSILTEDRLKQVTGTDAITCRRMREDFWSYYPEFTIFAATNHLPIVKSSDLGTWRRIYVVRFDNVIPLDKVDVKLKHKLMQEADGIFQWLYAGYKEWDKGGLQPPVKVSKATEQYQTTMDLLSGFYSSRCVLEEKRTSEAAMLYATYKEWAEENDEIPMAKRRFYSALDERGFQRVMRGSVECRQGIGLKAGV